MVFWRSVAQQMREDRRGITAAMCREPTTLKVLIAKRQKRQRMIGKADILRTKLPTTEEHAVDIKEQFHAAHHATRSSRTLVTTIYICLSPTPKIAVTCKLVLRCYTGCARKNWADAQANLPSRARWIAKASVAPKRSNETG